MRNRSLSVEVDVDISDLLDALTDDEVAEMAAELDEETLAKVGLVKVVESEQPWASSLDEHLALVRGVS